MCSQLSIPASSPADPVGSISGRGSLTRTPARVAGLLGVFFRRPILPRLDTEGLSAHRLRDLGLADGRLSPRRDPLRD